MEIQENIEAVERMQAFIDAHLKERITLHMLAEAAGYSPWHAARMFKELTGRSPFDYIRMLRLSRAAVRLREEEVKVVDVAFDFLFDSHEGFTRAFTRHFGITPKNYTQYKPPVKLFIPEDVHEKYLALERGISMSTERQQPNTIFVQVVKRPARKLILKRGVQAEDYFAYCDEVGCEVWDVLTGIKHAIYEPIGMWLPDNLRPDGTSVYAQGVEVPLSYTEPLPVGFDMITLPACMMMIFQGQPYDDNDFQQAIGDLWEAMKNYKPEIYGFRWADEDGPRFQLEPQGYRGYIEGRPVRPLN
jgi:AraC-like DNA-binding protein